MSLLFRPRHNTAAQISLFVVAAGALGGIGGLLAPLLVALGALSLAVVTLRVAYEKNLGGFRDFVVRVGHVVSLVLRGLGQLFADGGFECRIKEEL